MDTMFTSQNEIQFFESALFESLGKELKVKSFQLLTGGSINNAVKVQTYEGDFFIKWNERDLENLFEVEAKALQILQKTETIRLPQVIGYGKINERQYLILEYIQSVPESKDYWEILGKSLARLHQHNSEFFGLSFDNYIGTLRQNNQPYQDGITFFIEKRLKVQAGLAFYNEKISRSELEKFERFYEKLPNILPDEKPTLLHGDLWKGNVMSNSEGLPILIDPATYYGYREAEIAFTHLFGGFDTKFYETYQSEFPLEKDFEERIPIYNLYPLLVHLNLFGNGYLSGVMKVLDKF